MGESMWADCKRRCEQRLAAADSTRGERHVMIAYERSVTMYMAAELPGGRAAGFTKEEACYRLVVDLQQMCLCAGQSATWHVFEQ